MTKTTLQTGGDSLPLSPVFAARMLASELGESEGTWLMRLANWRRPARHCPLKWHHNDHQNPIYEFADVRAYIDIQLTKRAATAAPDPAAGMARASAVADVDRDSPLVRVLWNGGTAQGAFNLSIEAARLLTVRISQAVEKAESVKSARLL